MQNTSNYKLNLIELFDTSNITKLNDNANIIDELISQTSSHMSNIDRDLSMFLAKIKAIENEYLAYNLNFKSINEKIDLINSELIDRMDQVGVEIRNQFRIINELVLRVNSKLEEFNTRLTNLLQGITDEITEAIRVSEVKTTLYIDQSINDINTHIDELETLFSDTIIEINLKISTINENISSINDELYNINTKQYELTLELENSNTRINSLVDSVGILLQNVSDDGFNVEWSDEIIIPSSNDIRTNVDQREITVPINSLMFIEYKLKLNDSFEKKDSLLIFINGSLFIDYKLIEDNEGVAIGIILNEDMLMPGENITLVSTIVNITIEENFLPIPTFFKGNEMSVGYNAVSKFQSDFSVSINGEVVDFFPNTKSINSVIASTIFSDSLIYGLEPVENIININAFNAGFNMNNSESRIIYGLRNANTSDFMWEYFFRNPGFGTIAMYDDVFTFNYKESLELHPLIETSVFKVNASVKIVSTDSDHLEGCLTEDESCNHIGGYLTYGAYTENTLPMNIDEDLNVTVDIQELYNLIIGQTGIYNNSGSNVNYEVVEVIDITFMMETQYRDDSYYEATGNIRPLLKSITQEPYLDKKEITFQLMSESELIISEPFVYLYDGMDVENSFNKYTITPSITIDVPYSDLNSFSNIVFDITNKSLNIAPYYKNDKYINNMSETITKFTVNNIDLLANIESLIANTNNNLTIFDAIAKNLDLQNYCNVGEELNIDIEYTFKNTLFTKFDPLVTYTNWFYNQDSFDDVVYTRNYKMNII